MAACLAFVKRILDMMEEGGVCNTSDYAEVEPDQAKFRNAPGYMRGTFLFLLTKKEIDPVIVFLLFCYRQLVIM